MITTPRLRAAALSLAIPLLMAAVPAGDARRHTRLVKSIPASESVVSVRPEVLQLWFSEPIELSVSRIRLETANAKSVTLSPLQRDDRLADAPVTAAAPDSLAPGKHTVHWTAVSKDGHVVRGSFTFTFAPR